PFEIKTTSGKTIRTPISLISITDFSGESIAYSSSKDYGNKTITWKIGDADKTVSGENEYRITYEVQNAVWPLSETKDEFYWNLSGNFWQIDIDSFSAEISFPEGIDKEKLETDYYAGPLGGKSKDGTELTWNGDNLNVISKNVMRPGDGITLSVVFPKGTFIPYQPPFWEKYAFLLWLILPGLTFLGSLKLWQKYGRDPKNDKTIIPEFEVPDKLSPGELLLIEKNGSFRNEIITASLVDLAVKGVIRIEEIKKSGIFGGKDYRIVMIDAEKLKTENYLEKTILEYILSGAKEKKLSDLKNNFTTELISIKKLAPNEIIKKGYMARTGLSLKIVFLVISLMLFFASFPLFGMAPFWGMGVLSSSVIVFIFAFLMPKRTKKGAETAWKIKGFKLYLETAEKYRQEFNEKENIFEKFLPYAVVFGMTKLWIKKMKEIYGENYFNSYHPIWYSGMIRGSFDVDSFTSSMESVSSAIASNISSGSGAGGGGFSGGGGGGGGGGGW
ncbi:MAG: DUF2207 domain-containing protein, partial [Patescibacteria group bacterium]